MAEDIKALVARVAKLENDLKTTQKALSVTTTKGELMELQIRALQKDGVAIDSRVKAVESKKN